MDNSPLRVSRNNEMKWMIDTWKVGGFGTDYQAWKFKIPTWYSTSEIDHDQHGWSEGILLDTSYMSTQNTLMFYSWVLCTVESRLYLKLAKKVTQRIHREFGNLLNIINCKSELCIRHSDDIFVISIIICIGYIKVRLWKLGVSRK